MAAKHTRDDLFDIAERFSGMKELAGPGEDNPMILAFLKLDADWPEHDEVPWCSGFANFAAWIARAARSKSLRARSWGLHRPTTGLVYYRNSHTQGVADHSFLFGNPGDRFVTNDWNHNGIDTPAVFRPGNITHYFRFSNTQGAADARYMWGHSTWYPVTGTYNGR